MIAQNTNGNFIAISGVDTNAPSRLRIISIKGRLMKDYLVFF